MANEFGADIPSLEQAIAKMQQLADAQAELDAKVEVFEGTERDASAAIRENVDALERALRETRSVTTNVDALTRVLNTERQALAANTRAWAARTTAVTQALAIGNRVAATTGRVAAETVGQSAALDAASVAPPPRRASAMSSPSAAAAGMFSYDAAAVEASGLARVEQVSQAERAAQAQRLAAGRRAYGQQIDEQALGTLRRTDPLYARGARLPTAAPLALGAGRGPMAALEAGVGAGATPLALPAAGGTSVTDETRQRAQAAAALREQYDASARSAEQLTQRERELASAYHQSVAAYAESSTALSRNGALTTEFIQAFARGDVTLKEFTSQMTSTIGKFAGWAVAGAAVYGAFDAIKKLGQGAKDTQEGVIQLSRFIPNVSSGRGEQQLTGQFRSISTDLNVPIKEVTSTMAVMARSFHDVADAADATRAVLLATRLDQISPDVAAQSFTGIAQSFNLNGRGVLGVINGLNSLQNITGARVSQLLPAISRAAPAAVAGGISLSQLAGLADVGVRAGLPGGQVGTGLLRSISSMAFRSQNVSLFRAYGINAVQGQYGSLIHQIERQMRPGGHIRNRTDILNIANALGGPQLGGRTFAAIISRLPAAEQASHIFARPPQTAQQELGIVLGGIGEQAKKLGIDLENLGSELESAGILAPVQVALKAVGFFGTALEHAISPLTTIAGTIDHLNVAVKDAIGVIVGIGAINIARGSGARFVAQDALGRLPGLHSLQNNPMREVNAAVSRYRTFVMPDLQRELESSNRRVMVARRQQVSYAGQAARYQGLATQSYHEGNTEQAARYEAMQEEAAQKAARAEEQVSAAELENVEITTSIAQTKALIKTLTNKQYDYATRATYAQQQELVLRDELNQTLEAQVSEMTKSGIAALENIKNQRQSAGSAAATTREVTGVTAVGAASTTQGTAARIFRTVETPDEQLAGVQAAAEMEQPGITQQAIQTIGAETTTAAAVLGGSAAADTGATTASGTSFLARARGIASGDSQMALLGLTLGAGAAASLIPGQAGATVSSLATTAGLGAFLSNTGVFSRTALGASSLGVKGLRALGMSEVTGLSTETAASLDNPLIGAGLLAGAAGAGQSGTGGLIQGMLGNAIGLGTAGFMVGGPIGAGVGALAGAGLGFAEHLLGGGSSSQSHLSPLTRARNNFQQALLQSETMLRPAQGAAQQEQLANYGYQFSGMLQSAFNNGNIVQAQQEQQVVERSVRQQVQILNDATVTTGAGRTASGLLSEAIGTAATSTGFAKNPDLVGQIIDTAYQGILQANSSQEQFQVAQSGSPVGMLAALRQENARALVQRQQSLAPVRALRQQDASYRSLVARDRALLSSAEAQRQVVQSGRLHAAGGASQPVTGGAGLLGYLQSQQAGAAGPTQQQARSSLVSSLTGRISGLQRNIRATIADIEKNAGPLRQAHDLFKGLSIKRIEQIQSDAAATLQAMDQNITDIAGLAQAQAGGNRMAQYQAQAEAAAQELQRAQAARPYLSRQQYLSATRQARAQRLTALTGQTQESAARLQASQSAQLATFDQSVHPEQYAREAAANARTYYEYVLAHRHAFDATDISNALQNVNAANVTLADATYTYQSSVISALEQLQQAQHPDNSILSGQLQAASGRQMLAIARNRPERLAAQAQITSGQLSAREAARSQSDVLYQITAAEQTGNPVEQALTQVAQARHDLATALGPDEARQAQQELASANAALHQAQQDQVSALGQLAASQTNNQLKQDADLLAAAQTRLSQAIAQHLGPQVIQADTTTRNQARLQQFNDTVSQEINTIQYETSTLQISAQDALDRYERILRDNYKRLSVQQRQSLKSAIYSIETNMNNTSLFDLAPAGAGVKAPTIFDARTAVARERQRLRDEGVGLGRHGRVGGNLASHQTAHGHVQIGGAELNTHGGALTTYDSQVERAVRDLGAIMRDLHGGGGAGGPVTVHVHVGKGEAHKVFDVIDRALGSQIRSRMRAAGARGT